MWSERHRFRPKTRRNAVLYRRSLIAALATTLAILLYYSAETLTPHTSLARALHTLQSTEPLTEEQIDDISSYLDLAARSSTLAPWVQLSRAQLAERSGKIDEALKLYSEIPLNHPASFDAEIGRMRLESTPSPDTKVEELIRRAYRLGREDLLPQITFLQGKIDDTQGRLVEALAHYQELRKSYPSHALTSQAKLNSERILAILEQNPSELSLKSVLSEYVTLTAEGRAADALTEIVKLESSLTQENEQLYNLLLTKETVLRKLRRGEEADELLLKIGASGALGTGDVAILRSTKNAWNINDHHRALEFLDRLRSKFPESPLKSEAAYIEARILEEMSALVGASSKYLAIGTSSAPAVERMRAFKRLGWLYLTNGDFASAVDAFEQMRKLGEETSGQLKTALSKLTDYELSQSPTNTQAKDLADMLEDLAHTYYWERYSLSQASQKELARLKLPSGLVKTLDEYLNRLPNNSYYKLLIGTEPLKPTSDTRPCGTSEGVELPLDFEQFSGVQELEGIAKATINWEISKREPSNPEALLEDLRYLRLKNLTSRVALYTKYLSTRATLELAERGLRQINRLPQLSAELLSCQTELLEYAYPMPMLAHFRASAKRGGIEPELLLGIARTESFFDPHAESVVGARGIVQLMPATAKQEGWNGAHSLYDPKLNLELGAKHLARLLGEFHGELPLAIAAYNAGGSPVNRWRARFERLPLEMWTELIGYPETYKYVKRVLVARDIYRDKLVEYGDLAPIQ